MVAVSNPGYYTCSLSLNGASFIVSNLFDENGEIKERGKNSPSAGD